MKLKLFGIDFIVSYPAVAFLALTVICDKNGAILFCFVSSVLHELGHIFTMKLKGAYVESVSFNVGDVAIKADSSMVSYSGEIIISLAGVAVNIFLAVISFVFWKFTGAEFLFSLFVANLAIGFFNLLPARFLDGGDVLCLILSVYISQKSTDIILNILTVIFMIPIFVVGLIFVFNSKYNYSLLFAAVYLICTLVSKEA